MGIRLSGRPPSQQLNGLAEEPEEWLVDATPSPQVVVGIIERQSLTFEDAKGESSATLRFRQIELLEGDLAEEGRALLERAFAGRTGDAALPIPLVEPELDLDTPLEDQGDEPDDEPWIDVDGGDVA